MSTSRLAHRSRSQHRAKVQALRAAQEAPEPPRIFAPAPRRQEAR